MILSRRSFLKLAGLTTVAAAGASMFTGCGAFSTTPIKVVAAKDSTKEFQAAVAELNKKKLVVWPADANGAYLNSFLMTNLAAMQIQSTKTVGGVDVADKVHLQLLSTDESKPREARVARQTTKNGLYNALDIGSIWLQKANENG